MYSVAKSTHLREVTIDGNPVAQGGDCVSFLVSYLPNLNMLSNLQVTKSPRTTDIKLMGIMSGNPRPTSA